MSQRIGFSDLIPGDDVFFFASRLSPPSKNSVEGNSNIKALCTMVIDNFVAIYGSEKMCLLFAYLPFFYQFLPIYRAPYSAYLYL